MNRVMNTGCIVAVFLCAWTTAVFGQDVMPIEVPIENRITSVSEEHTALLNSAGEPVEQRLANLEQGLQSVTEQLGRSRRTVSRTRTVEYRLDELEQQVKDLDRRVKSLERLETRIRRLERDR